ncbi:MAG TPA: hypothetical protein VL443_17170 [Cyclobacteriaceae bacterium]|jgi:hypothetical protein|nr:hypothetical protein [Cyclobacteriaceae bacterium]
MSLKKRFYKLIGLVLIWFVFGTMMLVRSNVDFDDLKAYEGRVSDIGTTVTRNLKGQPKDILYFNLDGLKPTLGIYHNTKKDYDYYLNKIHSGDIVKVYYNENGIETSENINLHVYQLEMNNEILLSKVQLNATDRRVGLILYGVGLLFSIAPIWFYFKKIRTI